jgi:hypothetical protein
MSFLDVYLTEPQERFAFCEDQFPAMVAGLGAGKSRASTIRLILLMIENIEQTGKGINTLYTMPTYDLLRLRAIVGVEEDLNALGFEYKTNKSEFSIFVPQLKGSIIFRSYDRPERLIAFECAHSIADELDTLQKEKASLVWRKITERTRQNAYRKNSIAVPTTPDQGVNGFVYQKWVKEAKKGYSLIKASTTSNPYLPEDYVDQIRSNYDPILADLYINGEFVSLSQNKVYHFFDRQKHHTSRTLQANEPCHISIDFNIGGSCATVWIIENNRPIAVDEFVSHDTQDFINRLVRFNGSRVIVYPDASGSAQRTNAANSDIELIRQAGYHVDAPSLNPFVRDRINSFNALFAHDRIAVNTDKCTELTHALETQGYTDRGEPEKFNDHPAIDDWVDSAGYFIHRRFPIRKPSSAVSFS